MADAEQAARPAGDVHAGCDQVYNALEQTARAWSDELGRLQRAVRDALPTGPDIDPDRSTDELIADLAAHVGQRDGGAAGDDTTATLRTAILDIDAHATPIGEDADGFVTGGYTISVGSLHRALGKVGHSAAKCTACVSDGCAAAAPRAGADTGLDGVTDDASAWLMVATGGRSRLAAQGDIGDIREALAGIDEPRHEVQCPSCTATIRARMADAEPSVPRAPVETLLAALDTSTSANEIYSATEAVRRHLDGDPS